MDNIDWHAGFVDAMKLELMANEEDLEFLEEHLIANRAQRIDLLIIKKLRSTRIVNEVGDIFDKYNVIEYKSPQDGLNYGDFYKILAYTCIYLQELHEYNEYGRDAFTMTLVRRRKPRKLFSLLERDGYDVHHVSDGIYEVIGPIPFRTQIIVTNEWDKKDVEIHAWLRGLTNESKGLELEGIVSETIKLNEEHKKYADGVMNVYSAANIGLMRKIKEVDKDMCKAVNELFAEETQAEKNRADKAIAELSEIKRERDDAKIMLEKMGKQLQAAMDEIARLRATD